MPTSTVHGGRHHPRALVTVTTTLALLVGPAVGASPASAATDEPPVVTEPTPSASAPVTPQVVAPTPETFLVDGDVAVGGSLDVHGYASDWQPPTGLEFTYQWVADDVPVSGATSRTLTPSADLVGTTLALDVTGTLPGDPPSSATVRVPAGTVAPGTLDTGKPQVTGPVEVGGTVAAQPGTWPAGTVVTTTWLVGDVVASTDPTLTLTAEHQGLPLVLRVVGSLPGYEDATVETAAVTVTAAPAWPTPTVTGTARVGSKLTAQPGSWPAGTQLTYRWLADGRTISGATGRTLTLQAAQRGTRVTVQVTGTRSGAPTVTRDSAARTVAAGVLSAPRPTVSGLVGGKAKVGKKLTAKPLTGSWSPRPTTLRYRWKIDGKAISGATSSTYTPKSSQAGKKITVTVTGYRAGYTTKKVASSSVRVAKPFARAPQPTITGKVRLGSTLRVVRGSWNPDPTSFRYQWKANGKAIPGATGKSYKLRGKDYGKRISVTVTAQRKANLTTSRTSAKTSKVKLPPAVLTKDGTYRVGRDIKPGTYAAYVWDGSWCRWERRTNTGTTKKGSLGHDYGYGHRLVTIKKSDKYFRVSGCGSWYKYYPVGGQHSGTGSAGTYEVGPQIKPGLYRTSGPIYDGYECLWVRLNALTGYTNGAKSPNIIASGTTWGTRTVRIRSSDKAFETDNCRWERIGD